jgi:cellulose synthase/poly-beta-1,6-N-acetylglucosamine synthase-like glycosyltransferase
VWHHTTWLLILVLVLLPVLYSYVVYPIILELGCFLSKKGHPQFAQPEGHFPEVHILMAVYNEEIVLPAKMASIVALDYPAGKLHVWIGSDASTDATPLMLKEWSERIDHLHLHIFESRRGKAAVINELAEAIKSVAAADAVILLTDADIIFSPGLLQHIVPHFDNSRVGLVDTIIAPKQSPVFPDHESRYWQWENRIKWMEGALWGCTMGASGGCYAIRIHLFHPVPQDFIVDDFFLSMHVLQQGSQAIMEEKAQSYVFNQTEAGEEFRRKRRIAAGNWQNFRHYAGFFADSFFPVGFCFFSHKYLRWITPFLLTAAWMVLLLWYLLGPGCPWWLLIILLLSIATPLSALVLRRLPLQGKWLFGWVYFIWMQYALAIGAIDYLKGIRSNVWEPTKRVS